MNPNRRTPPAADQPRALRALTERRVDPGTARRDVVSEPSLLSPGPPKGKDQTGMAVKDGGKVRAAAMAPSMPRGKR